MKKEEIIEKSFSMDEMCYCHADRQLESVKFNGTFVLRKLSADELLSTRLIYEDLCKLQRRRKER